MKKIARLVLGGFLLFLALSCGRKGPLQEPVPRVPQKVENFEAVQAGDRIIFSWQPPERYLDGRQLKVAASEIYGLELAAPPSSEQELSELLKKARPVGELALGRLSWDKNQARLDLIADKVKDRTYLFALKVKGEKGGWSEFSKPVVIKIGPIPDAPAIAGLRAAKIKVDPFCLQNQLAELPVEKIGLYIYSISGAGWSGPGAAGSQIRKETERA
jgi:predicted small lipoprotein YifL